MPSERGNKRACIGQVIEVRGSPGPASGITVDVVLNTDAGGAAQERYNFVHPVFLPSEFDLIIRPGALVIVAWVTEEHGLFSVQWEPVTTNCGGAP